MSTLRGDDRGFAIDVATIAVTSVLICVGSQRLALMSVAVPLVVLVRFLLWARGLSRRDVRSETLFFAFATALGGLNDWTSVVRHRVYDYTVPSDVPWSTIPLWMFLYWGMILRFLASLARWHRLRPPDPRDAVRWLGGTRDSAALKVTLSLVLVFATRQSIYRLYLDPIWSWAPFAAALGVHLWLFGWGVYERRLVAVLLVGGTLAEALYIRVGHLHVYHLGWLGGVPLWIALWWCLGVLIWADVAPRIYRRLGSLGAAR